MSNSFFQFKRFTVWHDRCAMKVGTDGVLLGAWVPVEGRTDVLDVGTGTGLIALQLAQRAPWARIVGIEIDRAAAEQAEENVGCSAWKDRITVACCDFRDYNPPAPPDLIVSNPPYFLDATRPPDRQRSVARHADSLDYELLFRHSSRLLHPNGLMAVIIPYEAERTVEEAARAHGLHPLRRMRVFTKPGRPCRRLMLAFSFGDGECVDEELCIEQAVGGYSKEYVDLTREFYLKM